MNSHQIIERLKISYEFARTKCAIHTKREFAEAIGWKPTHLSSAFNGDASRLTKGLMESIAEAFPQLNKTWLLTGEGEMLVDNTLQASTFRSDFKEHKDVMVPLVHIDSVGGMESQNMLTQGEQYVERMVPFPDAHQGDVAILQSGSSMTPTIPPGAILQIRKVDGWREYFGYGSDFVLWLTDDRRITKQVLKYIPDPEHYVTCHSYNPEVADEELPKSMIREAWKVVNVLINKGW